MWKSRLFWKFFCLLTLLSFCLAAAFLWVADRRHRQILEMSARSELTSSALIFRRLVADRMVAGETSELEPVVKGLEGRSNIRFTVVLADGVVAADTHENPSLMRNHSDRPEFLQAARLGSGEAIRFSATLNRPMMYVALTVGDGEKLVGFVRTAIGVGAIDQQAGDVRRVFWGLFGLFGVISLPLVAWFVSQMVKPVTLLTQSARAITEGDYTRPISIRRRDEIGLLARGIEQMQSELARRVRNLEQNSERLETVLGSMVEGVLAVDAQHKVLFANQASKEMLDISVSPVIGRNLLELVRNLEIHAIINNALASGEVGDREIVYGHGSQKTIKVLAACFPGEPRPGVVLAIHDVSELRRLENLRREFVANVSHELKTPLSAIRAYAETLRLGAIHDQENNLRFLSAIEEQADCLHQLIMDMLQLSRVESGREVFECNEILADEILKRRIKQYEEVARSKSIELRVEAPDQQVKIWADVEALVTIVDNLIDNAIKYTPEGGRVSVRWYAEESTAVLLFSDSGIGISAADQERVFERFYRVDKARSREMGGTGLGLAIVKHLVQALRGSIELESEVGKGSTFRIQLPSVGSQSEFAREIASTPN